MSNIRFYVDEHVASAVVAGLRLRRVDVVTVQEAGLAGATDDVHLEYARAQARVIFTQDADFLRLAAQGRSHSGIIYAPQRTAAGHIIRGLILVGQVLSAEDMVGIIEYI